MRVFKHRHFHRWAKSEKLSDVSLRAAVDEMRVGLHNGDLGGGLYKKRIASSGKGKRGGYRTILAFKSEDKAFFLYGYAKNVRDNIDLKEQKVYKDLSKILIELQDEALKAMLENGSLVEVT